MLNPLPYLDNFDELTFGNDVEPADPPKANITSGLCCPGQNLTNQRCCMSGHVNDLCLDEVEDFLERVEARKCDGSADPYNVDPSSPFYGRTTPLMYGDESLNNLNAYSWPEEPPPSYVHTPSNVLLEAPSDDADNFKMEATSSNTELRVMVPDFTLLNTHSPVAVSGHNAPQKADILDEDTIDNASCVSSPPETKVKAQLKKKIQKRRMESGKEDLVVEWNTNDVEQLTERDLERRSRRRASNRRAAQKSRQKKRQQNDILMTDMDNIAKENDQLRTEVGVLRSQLQSLTASVRGHLRACTNPGDLPLALQKL